MERPTPDRPGRGEQPDPSADPLRHVAQYRVDREAERERAEAGEGGDDQGQQAPRRSMEDRAVWVDTVIDQAIRRGEFDDLPLAGKPIPGLSGTHDPDWWLKGVIEREQLTGLGPPALQLRTEDARLDERLDQVLVESDVREILEEFNARVVDARRQLLGGPPVVTPTRDVEAEVARWRERQAARRRGRERPTAQHRPGDEDPLREGRSRWWRLRRDG